MNADNGIVRFVNDGVTGYYQANINIAEADMDINHLVLAGDDVRLDSRMFLTSGVTPRLEFAATGGTRRLNTNGSPLHLGAGIQVINAYNGLSTGAFQQRHIIAVTEPGSVRQRLALATGPYSLPIGNTASAQPMFMQFSTIPALEINEVRVWFTATVPPTLSAGDLCGATSVIGYGGRFHHDAYNGVTPVHSLSTVRYGMTVHPHNFIPPAGATDFTLMQQHSAAAGSPFGTNWHPVRSNTIGWGGNPECVVSSAATAISTDVNIAYFSVSGAGAASTPFPVDFNELKAQADGEQILLNWNTQGERNLSHFVVERIAQDMPGAPSFFTDLTQVTAASPSQGGNHSYSYPDTDVVPFQPYLYRLRMTDFDGYAKYSNIVSAMITDGGSETKLTIYPNPSNGGDVTTAFSLYQPGFVSLKLLDATGREVRRIHEGALEVGQYNFSISTESLAQGLYHLQMTGEGIRLASPLVIGSR
jgi:hypothetical protein